MENIRQKNMYTIVAIVKLAALFFSAIIIINQFINNNKTLIIMKDVKQDVSLLGIVALIILLIYGLWSFFSVKMFRLRYVKVIQIIENFIFVIGFSALIIMSNTYTSEYKFLFLLIIITSTIQLGMKYGMSIAIISSIIILGIDLVYGPKSDVNTYFENDLILTGIFILTAWTLGYYVRFQNENIEHKNMQLQKLNSKLDKQKRQRRYVEEILLRNEACYNILIENSREAILVHRENKIVFVNESAARMVGYMEPDELIGKLILDFTPLNEKDSKKERFDEIYEKKITMLSFEERIVSKKGDIISVQNTSAYFIYEGKPTILSILHDITPEKQIEKLQKDVEKNIELLNESRELNKLITEFLSNISHELKTPLNVIFSAVQVLSLYNNDLDEEVSNRQEKYFKMMKQNSYRLMRLINNLLDITKLDSGFLKLYMHNENIVSVIEEITLSVASYVESKEITLIFDTDVEEKIMAFDPDKIERIILNLLSNSIKFTNPSGEIYVNIMDLGDFIEISIKDTGIGIPEDKLEMIFERFGQVDKTLRRNQEGSGIGLCLVKSFVEMHGGKIKVKSKIGEGSEFVIKLPVVLLEEDIDDKSMYETNIDKVNIEFSDIYSEFTKCETPQGE